MTQMAAAQIVERVELSLLYMVCIVHAWKARRVAWATITKFRAAVLSKVARCFGGAKQPASTLETAVQAQMKSFRVEQARKACVVCSNALGPVLLAVACAREFATGVSADTFAAETFAAVFGLSILLYLATLSVAYCIRLTTCKIDLLFAVYACISATLVARMADDPDFFHGHAARWVGRVIACILYLDYAKAFLWNLLFLLVSIWRCDYNSNTLLGSQSGIVPWAVRECAVMLILTLVSYVVQSWVEARFHVQIAAQNQKRATLKFASYQCDAVFWLTPELRVSGPAPQLAGMLFMGDAEEQLEDRAFEDHLADDNERERFREFIEVSTAASDAQNLPGLLHVDLRDATDRTFPVELFHSCFVDFDDQVRHFIGVTEPREAAQGPPPPGAGVWDPPGGGGAIHEAGAEMVVEAQVAADPGQAEPQPDAERVAAPSPKRLRAPAQDPPSGTPAPAVLGRIGADQPVPREDSDDEYDGRGLGLASAPRPRETDRQIPREGSYNEDDGRGLGFGSAVVPRESDIIAPAGGEVGEGGRGVDPFAAIPAREVPDNDGATSVSSASVASYESVAFVPRFRQGMALAPFCLLFDVGTQELLGCSDGLCSLIGPVLSGDRLGDLISNLDEFGLWVQHGINEAINGAQTCETLAVKLTPSGWKHHKKVVFHATARIIKASKKKRPSALGVEHSGTDSERKREMLCIVEFTGLRATGMRKTAKAKSGIPSGSTWPASGRIGGLMSL